MIKARYQNGIVECVPLAVYDDIVYIEKIINHQLLWHQWTKSKLIECKKKCVLIFIPWKHKEKELVRVEYDELLEDINEYTKDWISIDSFVSSSNEGKVTIKKLFGYRFIYAYSSFICDFKLQNRVNCLEILFKEQYDLLHLQFDEEHHIMKYFIFSSEKYSTAYHELA